VRRLLIPFIMSKRTETLADLADALFETFLMEYGDAEIARLAAASTLTDLLAHAGLSDESEVPGSIDELICAA
jgi:hypothetical protein